MSLTVTYLTADEVYIGSKDAEDYWHEGNPAPIEVNNQEGQIRIGVVLDGVSESVGLYFAPARARDLIVALASAVAAAENA